MKKRMIAWAAALALALALTGCTAGRDSGAAADPNRGGAGTGESGVHESARPTPDVNDAEDGGGAGGTNDVDNDGKPETEAQARAYDRTHGGAMDDAGNAVGDAARGIGDGVGDIVRGAGNAIRDAGDAVGDAVTGR